MRKLAFDSLILIIQGVKMNMKKIFGFIGILFFMLVLVACGGSNSNLNRRNTELAEIIVEAVDMYLDGEINASRAVEIIDAAYDEIIENDPNEIARALLSLNATLLRNRIGTTLDLIDARNRIAEQAGIRIRN